MKSHASVWLVCALALPGHALANLYGQYQPGMVTPGNNPNMANSAMQMMVIQNYMNRMRQKRLQQQGQTGTTMTNNGGVGGVGGVGGGGMYDPNGGMGGAAGYGTGTMGGYGQTSYQRRAEEGDVVQDDTTVDEETGSNGSNENDQGSTSVDNGQDTTDDSTGTDLDQNPEESADTVLDQDPETNEEPNDGTDSVDETVEENGQAKPQRLRRA